MIRKAVSISRQIPGFLGDMWLGSIQNLPGSLGFKLRYRYWKPRLRALGENVRIDVGVHLQNPEFISIAANCWIDRGVMIMAGPDRSRRQKKLIPCAGTVNAGEVTIGRNVHIGPYSIISGIDSGVAIGDDCWFGAGVKAYAFSHHFRFDDRPDDVLCSMSSMADHSCQSMLSGGIVLEERVGVALHSIILPGVLVRRNSFVATNALLYRQEFAENSRISGSPAARAGDRFKLKHDSAASAS